MTLRRSFGFGLVLVLAAVGCDEPITVQPSVTGRVTLYDELGSILPTADGVQVSVLSPSSVKQYLSSTDASGWFQIELPESEACPLLFSREGFGAMLRYDVDGETKPLRVGMFAISSAIVTKATAKAESCGGVNCLALGLEVENFFGAGTTRRVLRIYLSTDPDVDAFEYQFTDLLFVPNDQLGLVQTGSDATFVLDTLHGLLWPFAPGTTVHLVIHGATENMTSSYTNPENGLEVFTDLSPFSARASFVIPWGAEEH